MLNVICTVSKYLIILFMILYTIICFTYFFAKNRKKRNRNLNMQIFYIFMIHFLCHICLFIYQQNMKVLVYYPVEIFIAVMYIVLFRFVYRDSSKLMTNNVAFLMLIGYTILLRLKPALAVRQFILATLGLLGTIFIPMILGKLKNLKNWNIFFGVTGLILLVSVFIPGVGKEIYGARNWISIGGITLQPMEFVKILFIFFVASSLVKVNTLKDLIINALIAAMFMLILVAEKDFGAVVIFYVCYFMMVYLATSRAIFPILGIVMAVAACFVGYALFKDSLFSHITVRVQAWQDPFAYRDTSGYQITQSLFAIGTGGFLGSGLGNGMPYLIPVSESDFIFSAICEELGLIFGICLTLVYVSSFLAMQNIAMKCKVPFFKYVTFGISITYIIQVLLNIGGATKFIPSTGVTLPLVSYGISSVFSTLIMFSIVQYSYIVVSKEADRFEKEREKIEARTYRLQREQGQQPGRTDAFPGS